METELLSGSHSFGECNYHLQFTPKYRREVFRDELVKTLCRECFKEIAKRLGVIFAAAEFGPDHAHLFVCGCKNYSPAELARRFKGASSRLLRKTIWHRFRHLLYGDSFWSDGYFYRSVGAVTSETVKFYVEKSQAKHWKALDYETYKLHRESCQTALSDYPAQAGLTTPAASSGG